MDRRRRSLPGESAPIAGRRAGGGWVAALAALCLFASAGLPAQEPAAPDSTGPRPIRGFSAAAAAAEAALEDRLAALLDAESTGRHFRYLTEEPHVAGSARNEELAHYLADRFRDYGLEDVRLQRYDVLLPYPEEVSVTMLEPRRFKASLKEDGYPQDKDSYADVGPTYLGMSASGDVTGDLVYAASGNPEDYDWLESQGIDLAGKIAIVRYSVPYSYRGFKALTAERRGLAALLIYSDPADDGYRKGLTFPDGPWGPASHIQRGSITYDFLVPGDPLTPGWASVEGARRIPVAEARSVPKTIMVPMSYRDARPLLEALGGPVAPPSWQGALPFTYRVGPGATRVRVQVEMDGKTRPIWVVEGRIRGAEAPDEMVVLGNHRDAWVYGGVDPSSGTASELELARVLGALLKEGHRPRRTIVLASWDAEEWHLTGSTEWGEQFAGELGAGAVAYLNVDSSTSGSEFQATAVASLDPLIVETARDVIDPNSRRSLLEAWRRDLQRGGGEAVIGGGGSGGGGDLSDPLSFVDNALGSGSDYTVFLNFLGVPVVEMTFDGPYGVYHSQYDDYYWVSHFGDPGFRYMTAMAEVWGRMALRLANAEVLPYDFRLYAERVGGFLADLAAQPGVEDHLDLAPARAAQGAWAAAAGRLEAAAAARRAGGGSTMAAGPEMAEEAGAAAGQESAGPAAGGAGQPAGQEGAGQPAGQGGAGRPAVSAKVALNQALLQVERRFLLADGIPGRPWFKHALYAPRPTYAAMTLPGVQEAIDAGDWSRAQDQLHRLTERFGAVAAALDQAAALAMPAPPSPP
jgi:N-acetylated-alpha-linked acidic dipeptidase